MYFEPLTGDDIRNLQRLISDPPPPETEFTVISQEIERIRGVVTSPVLETKNISNSIRHLDELTQRLAKQPGDTEARQSTKDKLTADLTKLQNYAAQLQAEVNKLNKEFLSLKAAANDAKKSAKTAVVNPKSHKEIATDVFINNLAPFLTIRDRGITSNVSKTWRDKFYKLPLQHKFMFLSAANDVVMRLPAQASRLGEFNRARKEALAVNFPLRVINKMQTVPARLTAIVDARAKQELTDQKEAQKNKLKLKLKLK